MIYERIEDIILDDIFFKARAYVNELDVYVKIEGLNIPGSIKLKPAKFMVEHAETTGILNKNALLIKTYLWMLLSIFTEMKRKTNIQLTFINPKVHTGSYKQD